MRPLTPDRTGYADSNGVKLHYEVYGEGAEGVPLLFLSAFCIIDSRLWNMQVPHFSRRHPCVVYDPPGAGSSDKPADLERHTFEAKVGDAISVLDATGFDQAVVVGMSQGGLTAPLLAVAAPERVLGMALINPTIPLSKPDERPGQALWDRWMRREAILDDYDGFLHFFSGQAISEPFSSIGIEDAVEWGQGSSPESVLASLKTGGSSVTSNPARLRQMLEDATCPALVIVGDDDRVVAPKWGIETAEALDVAPVIIPGGCHGAHARHPVEVNRAIDRFLERFDNSHSTAPRRMRTQHPRVLYLSSPIGLGHARRDSAIVEEMRALVPDLEVDWLAQPPVTRVLEEAGETIHPASRWLASESAHLAEHLHGHELYALDALRDMNEILAANFFVFQDVVEEGGYDLVVGDEAWDVDHYWHEDPAVKATRFAWLTDMVGVVPIPEKGARDVEWATEWNAQMLDHVERHPGVRDMSLFVGDPDDVVDIPFGRGLPSMRDWTRSVYEFSGYITGFDPAELDDRDAIRSRFGVGPDETLCVASVGGAGVGGKLLENVAAAHRPARQTIPELRTLLVAGPRIDPESLPDGEGLDRLGYVPNLHHLLAAADLAVVQGGLTTTMELTVAGVPFLYAPLQSHWEQQYHVDHRLKRHRAGRRIDHGIDHEELAEAMVVSAGKPTDYRLVPTGGARRAAERLIALI